MARYLDDIHPIALHAEEDSKGRTQVKLDDALLERRHLVVWLHHWVIDLLDEYKVLDFLDKDLDDRLSLLCPGITSDYVERLLEEGEEAVKRQNEEADEAVGRKVVTNG